MTPQYICLESKYAQFNSLTGTYHFQFSNQIKINKRLSLKYASVPNTIYNIINNVNNKIDFAIAGPVNPFNIGSTYTTTIPEGDYDVDSLSSQLTISLNNSLQNNFNVTFNEITNLFTITCTNNIVFRFGSGPSVNQSISNVIGFPQKDIFGTTITGSQMPSLNEPQVLYINIQNVPNSNWTSTNFQSQFTIPMNAGNSNYCIYNQSNNYKQEIFFSGSFNLYSFFDIALYCYMGTSTLPLSYTSQLNFVLMFEYE